MSAGNEQEPGPRQPRWDWPAAMAGDVSTSTSDTLLGLFTVLVVAFGTVSDGGHDSRDGRLAGSMMSCH